MGSKGRMGVGVGAGKDENLTMFFSWIIIYGIHKALSSQGSGFMELECFHRRSWGSLRQGGRVGLWSGSGGRQAVFSRSAILIAGSSLTDVWQFTHFFKTLFFLRSPLSSFMTSGDHRILPLPKPLSAVFLAVLLWAPVLEVTLIIIVGNVLRKPSWRRLLPLDTGQGWSPVWGEADCGLRASDPALPGPCTLWELISMAQDASG